MLGLAIFGLLWILYGPYRQVYVPNGFDIPALADGLLLASDASWKHWFTRGYSHFWELYPEWEWPSSVTGFTRPIFQFVIYIAHFVLDKDWASYNVISCFAAAAVAALAFQIAQTALGLRVGSSLLAAMLVLLSPPVLKSWLAGLAFAIEPLATMFVAGAFLAVLARRDFLCLIFLFLALFTKENALWAPFAAALTIMLRSESDDPILRRVSSAATMFLPVAMWIALRWAFFGGVGGTYATAGYAPLTDFLHGTFLKLTHLHQLFVNYHFISGGRLTLLSRPTALGTALLIYGLLSLWAVGVLAKTVNYFRDARQEKCWPTVDAEFLVTIWATIALAFHLALPLSEERYATSVVVFAWPALVAEVERRRKAVLWLGLSLCSMISLALSFNLFTDWMSTNVARYNKHRAMGLVLSQAPPTTRQIYVLPVTGPLGSSLQVANPKYVRLILDVPAEIVRIADIDWNCGQSDNLVAFNHSAVDGVIKLSVTLPACASFRISGRLDKAVLTNGHLYRSDMMRYELPAAHPIKNATGWEPAFHLGRRMTVYIRPNGPARFVIDRGGPNGIAWFDTP